MIKIILERLEPSIIHIDDITSKELECAMIIAKKGDKLHGMIIKDDKGWVLKVGTDREAYGYCSNIRACLEYGIKKYGYSFYII